LPAAQFQVFSKKTCLRRFFLHAKDLSVRHLISESSLVYRLIDIQNDSNSKSVITTTLFVKNINKEREITNPLSDQ